MGREYIGGGNEKDKSPEQEQNINPYVNLINQIYGLEGKGLFGFLAYNKEISAEEKKDMMKKRQRLMQISENPEELEQLAHEAEAAISTILNNREQYVLRQRSGLNDEGKIYLFKEIAVSLPKADSRNRPTGEIGVPAETASRIFNRAIRKLHHRSSIYGFESFRKVGNNQGHSQHDYRTI